MPACVRISIVLALLCAVLLPALEDPLAGLRPGHPRLLIDQTGEQARIGGLRSGTAPRLAGLLTGMRTHAAQLQAAPAPTRVVEGYRLLKVSRDLLDRSLALGVLWRLERDALARDRLRADLLAAAAFPDWNPKHFLDVAEMTAAMAIGYDWLYDELSAEDRAVIVAAIRDKGLRAGLDDTAWWVRADNNWNQVCHGGLVLGALAIGDLEPDLAARIIGRARREHQTGLASYAPSGVYPEGPGYWSYGTHYSCLMDQALVTATGQDWGLWQRPGFVESFTFMQHVAGPSGLVVNFADGAAEPSVPSCAAWAAVRLHDPGLAAWAWSRFDRRIKPEVNGRFMALLALQDEPPASDSPSQPQVAWVGRGAVQLACLRGAWNDPATSFIAMKAGRLRVNHGHLDAGSLVIDAGGRRFAGELGPEPAIYASTDAWGTQAGSKRWTYLMANNLGHNVLVLGDRLQDPEGDNPITGPIVHPAWTAAVADLSAAYRGQAAAVRRGVAVLADGRMVIRDECTGITGSNAARWQIHTHARATVASDGRSAVLVNGTARLIVTAIEAPAGSAFLVEAPIPTAEGQSRLGGWRRLVLAIPASPATDLTVTVLVHSEALPADDPGLGSLATWVPSVGAP